MPIVQDHPLRLRRLRSGLSQTQVAKEAGVSRSIVAQLEEGRVAKPNEKVVSVLANHTQIPFFQIMEECDRWSRSQRPRLSTRARNAIQLPPEIVSRYTSYDQWRRDIAENVTQFSSILGLSRNTLQQYEAGITRSMPKPLIKALYNRLDLSDEYVAALAALPREAAPKDDE